MLQQPSDPAMLQELARRAEIENQMRRVRNGAANFYWIAGLSILNSLITIFNGNVTFVIGLGITQLVDAFAFFFSQSMPEFALPLRIVGLGLSFVIAAFFILLGFFASKTKRWAFIVGLILYSLDTILVLVFGDWLGVLFHLLMLWGAVTGLLALNKLKKSLPNVTPDTSFPIDIGS